MTRLIKSLIAFVGIIIMLDILLMIMNGTMFYVILTLIGLYIILSLIFKEAFIKSLKRWLETGHFNHTDSTRQEVNHG
ncbi:hypothetical protein [Leuconostoc pseudomesenteroides]|uniref:hypothetical protein n=1 Tax=Leuconostoc pseudomesenteroides TaxID=33968 RepID=UPI0032E033AD